MKGFLGAHFGDISMSKPVPVVLVNRTNKRASFHSSYSSAAKKLKVTPADIYNALIGRRGTTHVHNHMVFENPAG